MEKIDIKKLKENNFSSSYSQTSSLIHPSNEFFPPYERCEFESLNEYNKLSSIKEHSQYCSSCSRKYISKSLLGNSDSNTKELIRTNLQNEWKLIALIADRFLFYVFSILTFLSTVILLIIVPLIVRNDRLIKPDK